VLPDLLGQVPADEPIGIVTADGAYDTRRCHKAITDRRAIPIIPIRRNGRLWKDDCPAARACNETLRATRHYGKAFWKRWTGYHARSRIEAKMRGLKSFGERIMAVRQSAEIHIRIALMNRLNALGTAERSSAWSELIGQGAVTPQAGVMQQRRSVSISTSASMYSRTRAKQQTSSFSIASRRC
jgi:hypothetical protein